MKNIQLAKDNKDVSLSHTEVTAETVKRSAAITP